MFIITDVLAGEGLFPRTLFFVSRKIVETSFSCGKKFRPKMQKLGLKTSSFKEIWKQNWNFWHIQSPLSEICNCPSEFCQNLSCLSKICNFCLVCFFQFATPLSVICLLLKQSEFGRGLKAPGYEGNRKPYTQFTRSNKHRANIKQAWWNPAPGSSVGLSLAHSWSRVI